MNRTDVLDVSQEQGQGIDKAGAKVSIPMAVRPDAGKHEPVRIEQYEAGFAYLNAQHFREKSASLERFASHLIGDMGLTADFTYPHFCTTMAGVEMSSASLTIQGVEARQLWRAPPASGDPGQSHG